jgi:hypothetical protein
MRMMLIDVGFAWVIGGCVLLGGSSLVADGGQFTVVVGGTITIAAGILLVLGALLIKRR